MPFVIGIDEVVLLTLAQCRIVSRVFRSDSSVRVGSGIASDANGRVQESLSLFRQDRDHRCSAWEIEIRLSELGNCRDGGPRPAIDKRRPAGNERVAQARVGPEITEDGPVVQEEPWF